jgi:hypothetical protein
MGSSDVSVPQSGEVLSGDAEQREELVRRVASSSTFEKSPRLRAFLVHVCRCALDGKPESATEQQIGIHVYDRAPGYNPNEDNIVRSQARLLRMKLEHHFANEGKDEPVIITVPKGRYLPAFEDRVAQPAPAQASATNPEKEGGQRRRRLLLLLLAVASIGLAVAALVWVAAKLFQSKAWSLGRSAADAGQLIHGKALVAVPLGEARIAAGNDGTAYTDVWGRRWAPDRYFEGGVSRPGPRDLFPPVADPGLFRTIREAPSAEYGAPQSQREFRYNIPMRSGVYELRLYFADPIRHSDEGRDGAQNIRHFQINLNGRPLLTAFDPIADAGSAAVDVRAFKDVSPAEDGMVHLEFLPGLDRPFVSAIELTPGTPGKLEPIRISAHKNGFVDQDGVRWGPDDYFIDGRTTPYTNPKAGQRVPELYTYERYGNFSYAIPVPPGSYTVRLHFAETFYSPFAAAAGLCGGQGCRVFDVTCNGVALLSGFDVSQAAQGAFRPVVRTFRGLHPNGQGKMLLSFSPRVNYAEVRAVEVIDEGQ